jgi:F0F1-type ATP synthase assembly protein I
VLAESRELMAESQKYTVPVAPISRENLQLIGQLSTIGFSFVFAIVIGFGGGYVLDGWLGSRPWLTFLGFFLGLAAGILNVYRVMQLANKGRSGRAGW